MKYFVIIKTYIINFFYGMMINGMMFTLQYLSGYKSGYKYYPNVII